MVGKKGMMKVTVSQVPLRGKTTKNEHEVAMTATTLGAMAAALGLDLKNRNVLVNGQPATAASVINPNDSVELRVSERPQGS